jgi:hypothetical protein
MTGLFHLIPNPAHLLSVRRSLSLNGVFSVDLPHF